MRRSNENVKSSACHLVHGKCQAMLGMVTGPAHLLTPTSLLKLCWLDLETSLEPGQTLQRQDGIMVSAPPPQESESRSSNPAWLCQFAEGASLDKEFNFSGPSLPHLQNQDDRKRVVER